jgi:hypothetical protein
MNKINFQPVAVSNVDAARPAFFLGQPVDPTE